MPRILLNNWSQVSIILLLAQVLAGAVAAQSQIPIEGGCEVGMSQALHGVPVEQADARIRSYANLYNRDYSAYKDRERKARRAANQFMLRDDWNQDVVIDFTREQRELLYIAVGGDLAQGRITVDELPGYVDAIENKIFDIEAQLGCKQPATDN